jgi:acetyl-CoA/propionyl-CoA carboxylase biotin carboxyl carrier protein
MAAGTHIRQVGDGVYRVEIDGRAQTMYVAGPPRDRWVFWDGRVFHGDFQLPVAEGRVDRPPARQTRSLTAPMPATVIKVQVKPGDTVKKGTIVVVLEAMKMELPMRASGDGVVAAVRCREGELVPADAPLVDFE